MEQDQENDYNQKFNGGVWKRIVKEFAFFKLLFISGFIFSGLEGICAIAQPKITRDCEVLSVNSVGCGKKF